MNAETRPITFAGWAMPIHYPLGILGEHRHTRAAAGLFDVSHMGQIVLRSRTGYQTGIHWGGLHWRFLPTDFRIRSLLAEKYGAKSIPDDMTIEDPGPWHSATVPSRLAVTGDAATQLALSPVRLARWLGNALRTPNRTPSVIGLARAREKSKGTTSAAR